MLKPHFFPPRSKIVVFRNSKRKMLASGKMPQQRPLLLPHCPPTPPRLFTESISRYKQFLPRTTALLRNTLSTTSVECRCEPGDRKWNAKDPVDVEWDEWCAEHADIYVDTSSWAMMGSREDTSQPLRCGRLDIFVRRILCY